jgi:2-polyprenyl-3-methyl-5-hydroxy-6-metoxy-1,4-benzoquinol methylase
MMIIAYFDTLPCNLKLLDFGMGRRTWCQVAKPLGCGTYGFEIAKSEIRYAESHGIQVINRNELAHHRFDFINTEQVFEHIAEPLETLCFLKQSLGPEGLIKISVPFGGKIKKRLKHPDWTAAKGPRKSLNPVSSLEHINCFNPSVIIKMARLAGFGQSRIPTKIQYATIENWRPLNQALRNLLRSL